MRINIERLHNGVIVPRLSPLPPMSSREAEARTESLGTKLQCSEWNKRLFQGAWPCENNSTSKHVILKEKPQSNRVALQGPEIYKCTT